MSEQLGTEQKSPCECHDCTQARYRTSLQGQIDMAFHVSAKPVANSDAGSQPVSARQWYENDRLKHDIETYLGVFEFTEAYCAHVTAAKDARIAELEAALKGIGTCAECPFCLELVRAALSGSPSGPSDLQGNVRG